MNGIERIHIKSSWQDAYTEIGKNCEPTANALYPGIFSDIGMPLVNDAVSIIECTKEEAVSRYDWKEGIDTILHFANGTKATMQEKFLTYHISTMTFETEKGSGEPNTNKVGKVSQKQVKEIAQQKMNDLNSINIEALMRIIEGTARQMGLTVEE